MFSFFIIVILLCTMSEAAMQTTELHNPAVMAQPSVVFAHEVNAQLYWEALIQMARGKKDVALRIVHDLHNNVPIAITPAWAAERPHNIDDFLISFF